MTDKNDKNTVEAAAKLVHDLRTRLMTMRNMTALLDEAAPDIAAGIAEQITRAGERLDAFWVEIGGEAEAQQIEAETGERAPPLAVLYVDDDEVHRDIGARLLSQLGHKVTLCSDGIAALKRCEHERFDVIFLDEHTPVMRGTGFAESWASSLPGRARPYMVGMSNDPRADQLRAACLAAGMQDYMEKPVTMNKLQSLMARIARSIR